MEVAPAFLGLPAPQKWPAAAGWEQGWQLGAPAAPRRAHVKSKWKSSTKGLGGLDSSPCPLGRAPQTGPPKEVASWGGEAVLPNLSGTKPS